MNSYELAILYDPDLEIDLEKAASKVKAIVTDNGGKVTGEDNWGKRKLAYNINGQDHAVYVFYTAEIEGEKIQKIESTLNITDEVIRFLITKPDVKAIKKADSIKAAKAAKRAKQEEDKESEKSDDQE